MLTMTAIATPPITVQVHEDEIGKALLSMAAEQCKTKKDSFFWMTNRHRKTFAINPGDYIQAKHWAIENNVMVYRGPARLASTCPRVAALVDCGNYLLHERLSIAEPVFCAIHNTTEA